MGWFALRCTVIPTILVLAATVTALCLHLRLGKWDDDATIMLLNSTSSTLDESDLSLDTGAMYLAPAVTFIGIFLGGFTIVTVLPLFLLGLRKASSASMLGVELLWTFVFCVLWLAGGALSLIGTTFSLTASCQGSGLCMETQTMKGFFWLTWLAFFLYFMLLITLALVGKSRGKEHVLSCTTTHGEFFCRTPAAPSISLRRGARYASSGAASKRDFSENSNTDHRGRSIDTESVYSDLDQHAHRTPTFGHKRSETAPIPVSIAPAEWHEMGRVSPSKLSFSKKDSRFSLAGGEEIDIASLERTAEPDTKAETVPASLI